MSTAAERRAREEAAEYAENLRTALSALLLAVCTLGGSGLVGNATDGHGGKGALVGLVGGFVLWFLVITAVHTVPALFRGIWLLLRGTFRLTRGTYRLGRRALSNRAELR